MNGVTKRLGFIDACRSLAILLMLHGHFFSTTFKDYLIYSEAYRTNGSSGNILFDIRYLLSGMTASLFFTITGFVFAYLLLKEKAQPILKQPRVLKGAKRAIMLIIFGYLLQLNFKNISVYMRGEMNISFYNFHVLQSIGVSLLLIILLYTLFRKAKYFTLPRVFFGLGVLVFAFTPFFKDNWAEWYSDSLHPVFINVVRGNFGNFSLFPWLGYVFLGGGLGAVLQRNPKIIEDIKHARVIFLKALLLISLIVFGLFSIAAIAPDFGLGSLAVRIIRFGVILCTIALLYFIEKRQLISIPFLTEMGKETLSLYIIHAIILYGSVTGIGIKTFIGRALSLTEAMIGAIIFILVLGVYVHYKPCMKKWINSNFQKLKVASGI